MEGIGGDGGVFEETGTFPEQFLGSGEFAIDAVDEVVERVLAGHDKPSVLVSHVEPDGFALLLAEGGAAFPAISGRMFSEIQNVPSS